MENQKKDPRSVDERLAAYPEMLEQLRQMAEELEGGAGAGRTMDDVADLMVARVRQLGRELMSGCARQMAAQAPRPGGTKVRRHVKQSRLADHLRLDLSRRAGMVGGREKSCGRFASAPA